LIQYNPHEAEQNNNITQSKTQLDHIYQINPGKENRILKFFHWSLTHLAAAVGVVEGRRGAQITLRLPSLVLLLLLLRMMKECAFSSSLNETLQFWIT